jgi:hypothetical protein
VGRSPVEVHVVPGELPELAWAEAEGDGQYEESRQALVGIAAAIQAELCAAREAGGVLELTAYLGDRRLPGRLGATGELAGLRGGEGCAVSPRARLYDLVVVGGTAVGGLEDLGGLILAWFALLGYSRTSTVHYGRQPGRKVWARIPCRSSCAPR